MIGDPGMGAWRVPEYRLNESRPGITFRSKLRMGPFPEGYILQYYNIKIRKEAADGH